MTIASTARKAGPLLGNGSATTFSFGFKVFATGDVKVAIANSAGVETVLTEGADYTVSLNANQETSPGGTVTYPVSGSPLPTGSVLSIIGDLDYDQPLDLPSGGNFSPLALENQLDRATMQIQQLKEQVDRAAKLPQTSQVDADSLSADLARLADSAGNIDAVAGSIANVNAVAGNTTNINAVAGNAANINAVAGNAANINAVNANKANIDTVAVNIADIDTVVANLTGIQNASENAALVVDSIAQAVDGEKQLFIAGTNYTKGVTTQLTLTYTPAKSGTVSVIFDGVEQHMTEWSLVDKVITFTAAIPADKVEVHYFVPSQFVGLSSADLAVLGAAQAAAQASAASAQSSAAAATGQAAAATSAKTAAEAARDAAQLSAGVYATTAAGLAATTGGQYFSVPSADSAEYLILYLNNAGTAVEQKRYPSASAVSSLKTPNKNLFNPADPDVVVGYYINGTNGALAAATGFRTTGFIPVVAGQQYSCSHRRQFAWYNASKAFISGDTAATPSPYTVTAPAGAAYFRTAVYDTALSTFQFEKGAAATAYEPYTLALAIPLLNDSVTTDKLAALAVTADKIAPGAATTDKLADSAVTPKKASFFAIGKNMFDKAAVKADVYVSNLDGLEYANAAYYTSDYIPVTAGATYALSVEDGITAVRFTSYYNASRAFVAGGAASDIASFTPPAGAAFIRISIYKVALNTFQVEAGNFPSGYESYGLRLAQDYMPANAPQLVMPPFVYGVQGRECNVYLDNLHVSDADEYLHDVTSASGTGTQQSERWTWTPAGALTSGSLVVSAHDKRTGSLLTQRKASQRAAASTAGSGTNKKLLIIGDSLINAGVIGQTLLDIAAADVMGVTLLGTRFTTNASNRHEGRGGWTIYTYATDYTAAPYGANPFWIGGAVNFPQYLANNAIDTPDWVPIHLGINDAFNYTSDAAVVAGAATAFGYLDTLIASIKSAGAGVKVALMIPPPPSFDQDAFGASYGTGQTRWRHKRNILIWARELIAKYANQESNRVYLVPTNTALDTVNNMQRAAATPVNSRNTAVTVQRQSDGVHPADSGYQQIADALWAFLKFYA